MSPFSDPLADGPTIQRSTFDALRQGMTLAGTLALIEPARLTRPVVDHRPDPRVRSGSPRRCRAPRGSSILWRGSA
ncbi:MAG: tryptophan synthase subunit alpha [Gemmatimonadales bacterium]